MVFALETQYRTIFHVGGMCLRMAWVRNGPSENNINREADAGHRII